MIFPITGAYFTFFLSFKKKILPKLDKIGDLSYGLYIYAFPIQQLLLSKIPNINPYYLFVLNKIEGLRYGMGHKKAPRNDVQGAFASR